MPKFTIYNHPNRRRKTRRREPCTGSFLDFAVYNAVMKTTPPQFRPGTPREEDTTK